MQFKSKLFQLLGATCISALLTNAAYADTPTSPDENYLPFLSGLLDQTNMLAPAKTMNSPTKTFILPATPATAQWGVFNSSQPPVLTINSGDNVVIETMAASDNQVIPGATIDQIRQIQGAVPGRGPHTLTGPIYVQGAEPGEVSERSKNNKARFYDRAFF